jgi:hypothetical protein
VIRQVFDWSLRGKNGRVILPAIQLQRSLLFIAVGLSVVDILKE